MNILLVDDDIIDREHIKRTLHKSDFYCEISEAHTVDDGLKQFQEQHFDLVLLDYRMPRRDGIEMVMELRNQPKEDSTAIVMMSNSGEEQLALECLRAGAQDFLTKTEITTDKLHRAILHAQTRFELEQQLQQSYLKVKQLAEQDSLTGLANRYMFDESLKLAITNNRRKEYKLALLLIDLDNFKYINDTYGHDFGDKLLKKVVERISGSLRDNELFARLGGDEFAITLINIEQVEDASHVAQRVLLALEQPFYISNTEVISGASIGIAIHPDSGDTAEELFRYADIAMYRAKKLGRNQVCFFEDHMQEQFVRHYRIENQLRVALQNDQFLLYYQPIFTPNNKNLIGFEALIRWEVDGSMRFPDEFIPIAEESRLIIDIGRWVINEAISQLAMWKNKPYTMAINLSAVQLTDSQLPEFVEECLQKHEIDAGFIEFELTETALLHNPNKKNDIIERLSMLGCRIALDDFGIGFSSVSHLLNFPINTVKIDRTLLPCENNDNKTESLFRGLVAMIHSLGLQIVGEGVENQSHLKLCNELNVHKIQGFLLSKPLPKTEINQTWFN